MQRKDFIGDGIVVLLAVGLSDELLLQLVEPCLDTVRAHRVGGCYRFFAVSDYRDGFSVFHEFQTWYTK